MTFGRFTTVVVTAAVILMQVGDTGELTVISQVNGNIACRVSGEFESLHDQTIAHFDMFNSQIVYFHWQPLPTVKVRHHIESRALSNLIKIIIYHRCVGDDNLSLQA